MLERFPREINLVSSLRHPNVVKALDEGYLPDGVPYLVMEYVPGEDLHTHT
jgi:serine/threonine-protein kinase